MLYSSLLVAKASSQAEATLQDTVLGRVSKNSPRPMPPTKQEDIGGTRRRCAQMSLVHSRPSRFLHPDKASRDGAGGNVCMSAVSGSMALALAAQPAQPAASSVHLSSRLGHRSLVLFCGAMSGRESSLPLAPRSESRCSSPLASLWERVWRLFHAQVRMGIFKRLFGGFGVKKKAGRKSG